MHKLVAVLIALALALGACSADTGLTTTSDSSADDSGDDGDGTASGTGSGDDDGGSDGDDGGSDDGGDSLFPGGGGGDYCELILQLEEEFDFGFSADPERVEQAYTSALELLPQLEAAAPSEIKDDVKKAIEYFETVNDELAAVDYDLEALDESVLVPDAEVEAATERLDAYDEEVCGLGDDSDDGSSDGVLDGTETNDDGFGGDGVDEVSDFEAEILEEMFTTMGLDDEQVACMLEDTTLDDFQDESFLFDKLKECDISLAELGG